MLKKAAIECQFHFFSGGVVISRRNRRTWGSKKNIKIIQTFFVYTTYLQKTWHLAHKKLGDLFPQVIEKIKCLQIKSEEISSQSRIIFGNIVKIVSNSFI